MGHHYHGLMDEANAFRRASDGFVRRAQRINADQWSAATPCTDWNVRALVNHVAGEYLWVPEMMAGRTVADVGGRLDGDVLGEDPLDALIKAQRAALAAVDEPGALARPVHLSFGDVPAAEYATQMAIDSTIHAWELVDLCFTELQKSAEDWRSAGAFGPEKTASDASTQARLLALSGR